MTSFDTNWKKGSGATPLTIQDLFFGDAILIPIARSISLDDSVGLAPLPIGIH